MPTLSDEIIQSIRDNGPSTTSELAARLGERSRNVSQSLYSDPRATQENSRWIVTDGAYTAREISSDTRTSLTSSSPLTDDVNNPTDADPLLSPPNSPEVQVTTNEGPDQPLTSDKDNGAEQLLLAPEDPADGRDGSPEDDASLAEKRLENGDTRTGPEKPGSEGEKTIFTQPEPVQEKAEDDDASSPATAPTEEMGETDFEEEEVSQGIIEGALTAISESASASPKEQVKSTLDYLVAINEREKKVIRDFRKYEFSMTDSEILPLEGIETPRSPESMEDWFRVPRLQKTNPPEPVDEPVRAWLKISKSPHSEPKRYEAITVEVDGEDKQQFWEDAVLRDPTLEGLLESYRNDVWSPWAQAEIERQKVIKLYQRLHTIYQTIIAGDEQSLVPEVCVGVGIAAWEIDEESVKETLLHPILIQTLDLTLDEDDYSIVINPSQKLTEVASDALAGVSASALNVIKSVKEQLSSLLINPFNRETFSSLLDNVVIGLDPQGAYVQGDEGQIPGAQEHLQVSENWILFTRRRTTNVLTDDLRKLQELTEEGGELSGVAKLLFSDADDTLRNVVRNEYRGLSTAGRAFSADAKDLFFLKPFNQAQESIINRLDQSTGCVVQGPPGTGKTHTIANVICHYLAEGKRILVTSQYEGPLKVLKEQLPLPLQPLAVALLSGDAAGKKELDQSVRHITESIQNLHPEEVESKVTSLEGTINRLHVEISTLTQEMKSLATRHQQSIMFQDRELNSWELAKELEEQKEIHEWFVDRPPEAFSKIDGLTEHIEDLRKARRDARGFYQFIGKQSLDPENLPDAATISLLHNNLLQSADIQNAFDEGRLIELAYAGEDANDFLGRTLTLTESIHNRIQQTPSYMEPLLEAFVGPSKQNKTLLNQIESWARSAGAVVEAYYRDVSQGVELPEDSESDEPFLKALDNLSRGQRAFGLFGGDKAAKALIEQITINGRKPTTSTQWLQVVKVIDQKRAITNTMREWNRYADLVGAENFSGSIADQLAFITSVSEAIETFVELETLKIPQVDRDLERLFDGTSTYSDWVIDKEVRASLIEDLSTHRAHQNLEESNGLRARISGSLSNNSSPLVTTIADFLDEALGQPSVTTETVRETWSSILEQLTGVRQREPALTKIKEITSLVAKHGCPKWAKDLAEQEPNQVEDQLIPPNWKDSWDWANGNQLLSLLPSSEEMRSQARRLVPMQTKLQKDTEELVLGKIQLSMLERLTPAVSKGLRDYADAMQSMTLTGAGLNDARHLNDARNAMPQAQRAVPVWVMPHWRVSETMTAELGAIDLVIIDEASQSDIRALPALMRAKKLLVVGDDKQVSPDTGYVKAEQINEDVRTYLSKVSNRQHLVPGKSIYGLANSIFSTDVIRLKDHFRCVKQIIEFSNDQFYNREMVPCRVAKASEKISPPLVSVYVKGGREERRGFNKIEADAIVREISEISKNPRLKEKSIGIVSMRSGHQIRYIMEQLQQTIGPEAYERHAIHCGSSMNFQGREADIVFLSLLSSAEASATYLRKESGSRGTQQRYNVACSRARDRFYVYHSFKREQLRSGDIRASLLDHFDNPTQQLSVTANSQRAQCDSGFEISVFDELVARRFRVFTQVAASSKKIDLVVEGNEDRRLAIECDGDQYHQDIQADLERQRLLEGLGWEFWRIWGSDWARNQSKCLQELLDELKKRGIEPIGYEETAGRSEFSEARVVDARELYAHEESHDEKTIEEVEVSKDAEEDQSAKQNNAAPDGYEDTPSTVVVSNEKEQQSEEAQKEELNARRSRTVEIGDTVSFTRFEMNLEATLGKAARTKIVSGPSDPDAGTTNQNTPLAKALLGGEVGERIEFVSPRGTEELRIDSID